MGAVWWTSRCPRVSPLRQGRAWSFYKATLLECLRGTSCLHLSLSLALCSLAGEETKAQRRQGLAQSGPAQQGPSAGEAGNCRAGVRRGGFPGDADGPQPPSPKIPTTIRSISGHSRRPCAQGRWAGEAGGLTGIGARKALSWSQLFRNPLWESLSPHQLNGVQSIRFHEKTDARGLRGPENPYPSIASRLASFLALQASSQSPGGSLSPMPASTDLISARRGMDLLCATSQGPRYSWLEAATFVCSCFL